MPNHLVLPLSPHFTQDSLSTPGLALRLLKKPLGPIRMTVTRTSKCDSIILMVSVLFVSL